MENLLQNQIRSNCELALPDGLKELMSDISREVLRAQPQNLYDFIANYLSVLLVSREHLSIAHHVCDTVCATTCYKELEDELRFLGMEEENATKITEIIMEHFSNSETNKSDIMLKLVEEVDIDEEQMSIVTKALHKAFKRHLINNTVYYESSSDSVADEVYLAANHTLKLFRKTKVSSQEYKRTANNVKASYRALGVTRDHGESESDQESDESRHMKPYYKNIRFNHQDDFHGPEQFTTMKLSTVSSITLAGSLMNLPKYVPYSVHETNRLHSVGEDELDFIENYEGIGRPKISFQDPEVRYHVELTDDHSEDLEVEDHVHLANVHTEDPEVEDHAELVDVHTNETIEEVASLNSV